MLHSRSARVIARQHCFSRVRLRLAALVDALLPLSPAALVFVVCALAVSAPASGPEPQSGSNSAIVSGTVTDPTGAVVPGAAVELRNPVSQFDRTVTTGADGKFNLPNVPVNAYHMTVTGTGFAPFAQDVEVRSGVPVNLAVILQIAASAENITVQGEAGDLVETDTTLHSDVDRGMIDKIPLESASSQVSSLVTLATPGVTADSNGMFHGLGDHASSSFSLDGQPITDQQSKVFSNQIPLDAVQSLQVIAGAPPAEYGDKTSLVIDVTTRSGLGSTIPHGSAVLSYGSFGSTNLSLNTSYGNSKYGNFISVSGLDTGRFLDPPEFAVMHAKGNEENFFDRFDYVFSEKDALHVNLGFTRSWFQNPNSYDNLNIGAVDPFGNPVGPADQRSKINTFNIAPTYTRTLSTTAVWNIGVYVRHDQYNYYPSPNPFSDFGPLQNESVAQSRNLTNAGIRSDISYTKGVHNFKAGLNYQQTFLNENDAFGIVNPTLNSPCVNAAGVSVPGLNNPADCGAAGLLPNTAYLSLLACYDLTRPVPSPVSNCPANHAVPYVFLGHTDVKELGLYVQDAITIRNWTFSLGIRGDIYNGLIAATQAEPRLGLSYNVRKTNTVLRVSYARALDTPFNENLILSSTGCDFPVIAALAPCVPAALPASYRNEFHAGLQQAVGKFLSISGDYVWKYEHNAFDFSVFGNTPIAFPIAWHNSKIPGWALRASVPTIHGFTALVVMSSVTARDFPPQVGGLGAPPPQIGYPFRIDHDERFNQTTHMQYQTPWARGPWLGFNWRYDSGMVAGAVPCFGTNPFNDCPTSTTLPNGQPAVNLSGLTADQQFEAGLSCGPAKAGPFTALPSPCPTSLYGATLVTIPAPGTQNPDKNPARIAPRNLFDISLGDDNLFKGDRYKWSATLTVVNLTNKVALYNYLSTFSGTHYVTPRTITGEIGFHF